MLGSLRPWRGGSVAECSLEPVDGSEYGEDEERKGYRAVDVPADGEDAEVAEAGKEEKAAERKVPTGFEVDVEGHRKEDGIGPEVGWEFFHGVRSLTASGLALGVAFGVAIFDGTGNEWKWALGVPGAYCVAVVSAWAGDRWLFRRGQALLPADRYGSGRTMAVAAAVVFWFSGEPAGAALAGWLAASAVVVGGWSDGSWIAIVGKRNGLSFWRTWRDLLVREKEARKWRFQALFGEGRR